jgi:hypothetical protein
MKTSLTDVFRRAAINARLSEGNKRFAQAYRRKTGNVSQYIQL